MSQLYSPESPPMDFVGHLEELRRRILTCLVFLLAAAAILFSQGRTILAWIELPAKGIIKEFVFLTPTEVFLAYFQVILLTAFIVCFPVILYEFWAFVSPALSSAARRMALVWLSLAFCCFFGGIVFAYALALPAALKFLVGFGEGIATPMISLAKYVSFFSTLVLISGFIFEVPVLVGLLTAVGIVDANFLRKNRKCAILLNFIIAAVITPTPDVFNLLVFALPMIFLYEIGIVISMAVGRRKQGED